MKKGESWFDVHLNCPKKSIQPLPHQRPELMILASLPLDGGENHLLVREIAKAQIAKPMHISLITAADATPFPSVQVCRCVSWKYRVAGKLLWIKLYGS